MAGRTHTTRTPHRMNQALNRDVLGFVARQTVATQDFRKTAYVSPHGKSFHKARNVVSGEEYVVADGLGGATLRPGSVAGVMSFSGQNGEVLITRSPAGFGGAQNSSSTLSPSGVPSTASNTTYAYTMLGFCWSGSAVIIARRKITSVDAVETAWALEFAKVLRSAIPHLNVGLNNAFASIELTSVQSASIQVPAMQMGAGSTFYVWFYHSVGSAGATVDMNLVRIDNTGEVLAQVNYDASDGMSFSMSTAFVADALYATESKEGEAPTAGPPFDPHQRIVSRNALTLAVIDTYNVPNPASYSGWTIRTSAVGAIVNDGSAVTAYFRYTKQPPGGADTRLFSQAFTSALATSGAAVAFDDNDTATMGEGQNVKAHPGGGISFVVGTLLATRTLAGASYAEVLGTYDPDGGELFGIAQISTTETLVVGSGTLFATSILTSAGQELP